MKWNIFQIARSCGFQQSIILRRSSSVFFCWVNLKKMFCLQFVTFSHFSRLWSRLYSQFYQTNLLMQTAGSGLNNIYSRDVSFKISMLNVKTSAVSFVVSISFQSFPWFIYVAATLGGLQDGKIPDDNKLSFFCGFPWAKIKCLVINIYTYTYIIIIYIIYIVCII